ncbi:MAG: hypothetical protein HYX72_06245 [Acidobacteria bacterium]|nr:hypothetical protein [Acidobacteriota bacterium]
MPWKVEEAEQFRQIFLQPSYHCRILREPSLLEPLEGSMGVPPARRAIDGLGVGLDLIVIPLAHLLHCDADGLAGTRPTS